MRFRATQARRTAPGRVSKAVMACAGVAASLLSFSSHAECSDPSYAKMRPPKYPPAALAARVQGSVLLNVTVGIDGLAQELRIRTSSGNADLDQAAVESVSTWQFNPRRCDGKPELSIAVVPVTFDLSEMLPPEAIGDVIQRKPSEAGAPFLSEVGREIAHDTKAMPFQTVPEMLRFLKNDPSVLASRADDRIDSTTTLSLYFNPADRAGWQVVESTGNGWSAVDGGWTSIIRTRFLESARTTWELYSQLCNGDADWCEQIQRVYLQQMKEIPPPIPPPAPRSTEHSKN